MKTSLILTLLLASPLYGVGPWASISFSKDAAVASGTATTVGTVSLATIAKTSLSTYGIISNPIGSAVVYGGGKAVTAVSPYMSKYATKAMAGNLAALKKCQAKVLAQIKKMWFLPMRKEHAQAEALQAIINRPLTTDLAALRHGNYEQAECAAHHMSAILRQHNQLNLEGPCAISHEEVQTALSLMSANPNIQSGSLDMVLTGPVSHTLDNPCYISDQAMKEIALLDMSNLEVFLEKAQEIIQKSPLTHMQKEAMIVKSLRMYCLRLGADFKANELFKVAKYFSDFLFGQYYLTEDEIWEKYLAGLETIKSIEDWYAKIDLSNINDIQLEKATHLLADMTYVFLKGKPITAIKRSGGVLTALSTVSS